MRPFIFLLLLLLSCNTQKKISSNRADQELSVHYETIQTDEKNLEKAISLDESVLTRTGSGSYIEVIPRGAIRISPDGSFEGEASQVRIHHRDTAQVSEARRLDQKATDRGRSELATTEDLKGSTSVYQREKVVSRSPNFFVWIGAALGILLVVTGLRIFSKLNLF
ncbi:hypothetical protein SAMN05192553_102662 [Cyclobacterium xiamenense]|uniref:Uncharacterized protein n=1 Tax=Cyclobacterium xiamenense TaxID=1297121 RepID=A0A1H6WET1_9BACT|nr:hypothetical protein [Cyclobacterium xiamenense]SEJ15539.1 hypothetical protein SAMN05192553_102662 [Cyclobacterium xiamenense]